MTDIKSLAKRYNFSDFTEKHYITLIKLAKKKYLFEPFTTKTEEPHVLWRHDVDSSVLRVSSPVRKNLYLENIPQCIF